MQPILHITTEVLAGNKIEIRSPDLTVGEQVEVMVLPSQSHMPRRPALDVIRSLKGHRLFPTPAAVDEYLRQERESWAR